MLACYEEPAGSYIGSCRLVKGHACYPVWVKNLVLPVLALVAMMLGVTSTPLSEMTCIAGATWIYSNR